MFRLWCKLFDSSNHMIKDMVAVNDDPKLNRTKKIFDGIKEACIPRYASQAITLLTILIFLIWKCKLSKKINTALFINLWHYPFISGLAPLSPINAVSSSPPSSWPISHLLVATRSASSLSAILLCTLACFDVSG